MNLIPNQRKCLGCMRDYNDRQLACPFCGYSEYQAAEERKSMPDALRVGTILQGRYILGRVLSLTDFSAIYISWDALLEQRVAIREYFPLSLCKRSQGNAGITFKNNVKKELFETGRDLFEREAWKLNHNQDLSGIIHIYRCINENNTCYQVMEYLEGYTLQDYLDESGRIGEETAGRLYFRILDLVRQYHQRGIIHLNLSPDNIYLDYEGNLKVIDFGVAKAELLLRTRNVIDEFDHRYAAPELFKRGMALKTADYYSLGAIWYQMLTGKMPPNSLNKLTFKETGVKETEQRAIQALMEPDPNNRRVLYG